MEQRRTSLHLPTRILSLVGSSNVKMVTGNRASAIKQQVVTMCTLETTPASTYAALPYFAREFINSEWSSNDWQLQDSDFLAVFRAAQASRIIKV